MEVSNGVGNQVCLMVRETGELGSFFLKGIKHRYDIVRPCSRQGVVVARLGGLPIAYCNRHFSGGMKIIEACERIAVTRGRSPRRGVKG